MLGWALAEVYTSTPSCYEGTLPVADNVMDLSGSASTRAMFESRETDGPHYMT